MITYFVKFRNITEKKTSIITKFVSFRNFMEKESPKKKAGVYLVKMGVQIATWSTWAFQDFPPEGSCLEEAT